MEVGAVKQAFNNELILLKKKLNQAKIQTIHKLTRKAKTLVEKKVPEPLQEKYKKKATSAVKEVLIIKKIKSKDVGKFIITHKGQLQEYLNKPQVDHDKACARLLLHKTMQDKYNFIRNRFSNIAIEDLFMSRQERRKLKKEAREKQKNKKTTKDVNKDSQESKWKVENIKMAEASKEVSDENDDETMISDGKEPSDDASEISGQENDSNSDLEEDPETQSSHDSENSDDEEEMPSEVGKYVKLSPVEKINKFAYAGDNTHKRKKDLDEAKVVEKLLKKPLRNKKDNKKKNLNDKILSRKFRKDLDEAPKQEKKVVDPFFITSTGENYMSVADPRQPDEFKEEHREGNRKLRRAIRFGHVPKTKPRNDNYYPENRWDSQNGFEKRSDKNFERRNDYRSKNIFNARTDNVENKRTNFKDRNDHRSNHDESKTEKLHPSWEAKKKQSGILPFQGKKIVFD